MGGVMTTYIPVESRRIDYEAVFDVGRAVRSLRQNFPAWVCWYGAATRRWWGMPPPAHWYPALIEAATSEELALRIRRLPAAAGHHFPAERAHGHHHHGSEPSPPRRLVRTPHSTAGDRLENDT